MKSILLITTCILFSLKGFAQIPQSGLQAYFPFTGNAKDSSINYQHGTVYNASLTTDRFGDSNSAYLFTGNTNSYISFPATYVANNTYSYSLWCKLTSMPANNSIVDMLEIGQGGGGTGQSIDFANNYLSTYNGIGGGGYNKTTPNFKVRETKSPKLNQWYHVVTVRDTNFILLYIDDILIDSHGVSSKILPLYGSPVKAHIGIRCDFSSPFPGAIDEVCIYDRALSKTEVGQLYNNKSASIQEDLSTSISINLFPNPTEGTIVVKTQNPNGEVFSLKLYSMTGQLVDFHEFNSNEAHVTISNSLCNATYLAVLSNENGEIIKNEKLIINR